MRVCTSEHCHEYRYVFSGNVTQVRVEVATPALARESDAFKHRKRRAGNDIALRRDEGPLYVLLGRDGL